MATIIRADGTETRVVPRDGTFTLAELYEHTRCDMVQTFPLDDGRIVWCDEEAYNRDPRPPLNLRATELYAAAGGVPGWLVLGDVLITEPSEVD